MEIQGQGKIVAPASQEQGGEMGRGSLGNGGWADVRTVFSWRRSIYRPLSTLLLSVTSRVQAQGLLQPGGQGEFALITESAH